jgi:hypothetical protein
MFDADATKTKLLTDLEHGLATGHVVYAGGSGNPAGSANLGWDPTAERLAVGLPHASAKGKVHSLAAAGFTTHTDPRGNTATSGNLFEVSTTDGGFGGAFQANSFELTGNFASDPGAKNFNGLFGCAAIASGMSANFSGTIRGMNFSAAHRGAGTLAGANGAQGSVVNSGAGTITAAAGVFAGVNNTGGGTVGAARALWAQTPVNSAGTITDTYGVYVDAQAAGTQTNLPYGVYQAGAADRNHFAGPTTFAAAVRVGVYTVATLPTPGTAGRLAYASNGRKPGEGAGAGTGVPVTDTNGAWYSDYSGTAVTA